MSRIGNLPIKFSPAVKISVGPDNVVTVKGPKGELQQKVNPDITVKVEEGHINVVRPSDEIRHKAMHGLYRALLNNMIHGVTEGYKIEMEVVGVGYKAEAKNQMLEMHLGYSHDIFFRIPDAVKVEAKTERRSNPIITLTSHDKQLIGQVAAKIRSLRKPEPYKGKGVKFVNEVLRKKAGKSATAK